MKKVLTGALASIALAATLFTASAPITSTDAEARCRTSSNGTRHCWHGSRGRDSGIDTSTLLLLGLGGGLASPLGMNSAFAGSAAVGNPLAAVIPFLLIDQLDRRGRRR